MPLAELKSPEPSTQHCTYRLARVEDAEAITAVYEHVFGKDGIKAPGHEPYPAPEVFSADGVRGVIADSARQFIVAELKGQIAGGMIVNLLSPYNCEFCCVAVDPLYRGLGIAAPMLGYARQLAEATALAINSTEIVTHSVLSQTAHHRAGYGKVVGFGYCQYPRVFFAAHPESVLWVCEIQGRVADALRSQRMFGREDAEQILLSNAEDLRLLRSLSQPRHVYVPKKHSEVVKEILWQFADTIDYSISNSAEYIEVPAGTGQSAIAVDSAPDAPYGYLHPPSNLYAQWQMDLDAGIDLLKRQGKRYIQARIAANSASAVDYAEYLQSKGFIFLGLLPLHVSYLGHESEPRFDDLLVLQWIEDDVVAGNELAGETDSVIKLFGHPANLAGLVLKVMRSELQNRPSSNERPCEDWID